MLGLIKLSDEISRNYFDGIKVNHQADALATIMEKVIGFQLDLHKT